jgi:hypothetical protein
MGIPVNGLNLDRKKKSDPTQQRIDRMRKSLIATLLFMLSIAPSFASAEEVDGVRARSMIEEGQVLGMTLMDASLMEIFETRHPGFVYSVLMNGKLWYCFHLDMTDWFCETFE